MSHIKVIKSDKEHEQAMIRLMSLMDSEPAQDTCDADEIDVLGLLIERYEQDSFPIEFPDPIDAILFRMDQEGLKKKDLVPFIGSAPKVTEVLNGTRSLSLNMIRKLSAGLGLSVEVLIKEPSQQRARENKVDWHAFPLAEMRKRGYFDGFGDSLQELKEYAAEQLSRFISSVPSGFSLEPALLRTSAHLRSGDKVMNDYSLWAWQIRVLQKAQEEILPSQYEKGTVDLSWMRQLAQLSWSDQGPSLAKEYLNQSGIHLIIEPHLPRTYLDGAVCLGGTGSPVVALTLRHDRLDNFWFSLMHELAHIALHLDGAEAWYIDDLDAVGGDQLEQEADELAQEALVDKCYWERIAGCDSKSVRLFAKKLAISPCVIAGRLRHENSNHQMFGSLFRDKVRGHFSGGC
ncbi:MAG: ImmA/IrrE family metallo-endopeptidase [Gammaproteobacteria bacterium]|nr:ImmA/IrrE family metallo-endopeptidase [Gammaproteobacteria bacterium]MBQ0839323.1 ImmA/IrrE family metallo-endopeptidase [Gammaproteobacteria bacterium]